MKNEKWKVKNYQFGNDYVMLFSLYFITHIILYLYELILILIIYHIILGNLI